MVWGKVHNAFADGCAHLMELDKGEDQVPPRGYVHPHRVCPLPHAFHKPNWKHIQLPMVIPPLLFRFPLQRVLHRLWRIAFSSPISSLLPF